MIVSHIPKACKDEGNMRDMEVEIVDDNFKCSEGLSHWVSVEVTRPRALRHINNASMLLT